MPVAPVSDAWAGTFGLATVPLFAEDTVGDDTHTVLLEAVMDLGVGVIHPILDEHLPQAVSV